MLSVNNYIAKKVIGVIAGSICCLLFMGEPAYAGSLNANEQELISIIKGTYTYNGVTYRVKDTYIQLATDYLFQDDVDVTDTQKQKAINKMYSSIQQGIDEGYLYPIKNETSVKGSSISKDHTLNYAQEKEPKVSVGDDSTLQIQETEDMENIGEIPTKAPQILALESYAEIESDLEFKEGKAGHGSLPVPAFPWIAVQCALSLISVGTFAGIVVSVRLKLFHHKKRKRGML